MDPQAPHVMQISANLGLSTIPAEKTSTGWRFSDGEEITSVQIQHINKNPNSCFLLKNGELIKAEAFSELTNRYYSLMPTCSAPTMLISGIPMHRIKGTTPLADTIQKIKVLGVPSGRVLDTATGLGYTAIQAAKTAEMVITIEYDPVVLSLCRLNPWSQALFTQPNIHKLLGDSADLAACFPESSFNAIIHDPPTRSIGGQLYSQELYRAFYRILTPHGRLFHYIGNPDSKYGASIGRGVVDRLQQSGFTVSPKAAAFGVLAKK